MLEMLLDVMLENSVPKFQRCKVVVGLQIWGTVAKVE